MAFVVLQIRSGMKVLKPWYGCNVPEQGTLADLFQSYASGILDNSQAIQEEYLNTAMSCFVGKSRQELTATSTTVPVGTVVTVLGCYIEFCVEAAEVFSPQSQSEGVNAASILMRAYKDFEAMYEKDTSENHCPSKIQALAKSGGMPFTPTVQTANNVRLILQCHECEKWRLIYSKHALTSSEKKELQIVLENLLFSCGSSFTDIDCEESSVLKKVFCRQNINCSSPMEIPYYSTNHEDLCYYCGADKDFATGETFINKYPICNLCFSCNKTPIPSRKRKNITK